MDDLFIKLLCVQAKFNKNMEDLARSMKLNKSELLVLFDVLKHPLTSLNEICQRTGIKKSNGSRIIDKLIISKHLERKVCTDNRREIVVSVNSSIDSNHFCTKILLEDIFPNSDIYEEQEIAKIIQDLETLNKVL